MPDYGGLKRLFERLPEMGQADVLLGLGETLLEDAVSDDSTSPSPRRRDGSESRLPTAEAGNPTHSAGGRSRGPLYFVGHARANAVAAQPVAAQEMNWSFPCGKPLSKYFWNGRARVRTSQEPSSCWVTTRKFSPRR